jgi:precorrin isomerase
MNEIPKRPLIRAFLEQPMSGVEIEARSMEIIDREAPPHPFPPGEWQIVSRMIIEEGFRPSLVIALPVGFVHVVESKEELMSLGVPFITTVGHRGGSPLAISVVHALCGMAAEGGEEEKL